jgi:hypothetical protein
VKAIKGVGSRSEIAVEKPDSFLEAISITS